MDKMKVSIIIVNWNTRELLRDCLASLYEKVQGLPFEVLVVDNASTDGSVEVIRNGFPSVSLIVNSKNVGFAKANNQALEKSRAEYVLLLNSDTIVPEGVIGKMVEFMDDHPQAGAATGKLVFPDGSTQPYTFGNDPTLSYLIRRNLSKLLFKKDLHDWNASRPAEVGWVTGGFMMVRQRAMEEVGGLDENMFMYFEDNDWCLRMRQKGWKIFYNPDVEIIHLHGKSFGEQHQARKKEYYQSLTYFYEKHYGPFQTFLLRILLGSFGWLVRGNGL